MKTIEMLIERIADELGTDLEERNPERTADNATPETSMCDLGLQKIRYGEEIVYNLIYDLVPADKRHIEIPYDRPYAHGNWDLMSVVKDRVINDSKVWFFQPLSQVAEWVDMVMKELGF